MNSFQKLILVLLLFLTACSAQEESPSSTSPETADPQVCTPPPCWDSEILICLEGDCSDGCGLVCGMDPSIEVDWWQPPVDTSFHIQYEGPLSYNHDVDVYDVDLFESPMQLIETLHESGVKVVCYFSAGSYEDWRVDAWKFPTSVIGEPLEDWEGEAWLDIRNLEQLAPIMTARMDLAAEKGCDGVDPDNVDGYANDSGFPLTEKDQSIYNHWLVDQAHARGLAIGLKNDLDQIPALVGLFDFAVNEECFSYYECELLLPFIQQGKPVFGIEYEGEPEEFCPQANQMGLQMVFKNLELDEYQVNCWDGF